MKKFILYLVILLYSGCQKEKEPEFYFEGIIGSYKCAVEHYYVQLIKDLPENNVLIENLQCPVIPDPLNSDCGTLDATVSGQVDKYLINWSSFLVKSEFYPDTVYNIDLPHVQVEIMSFGADEIGNNHAYFKVLGDDFFDMGNIDQNPHYRLKSFEYDEHNGNMFLNIW